MPTTDELADQLAAAVVRIETLERQVETLEQILRLLPAPKADPMTAQRFETAAGAWISVWASGAEVTVAWQHPNDRKPRYSSYTLGSPEAAEDLATVIASHLPIEYRPVPLGFDQG